jgi:hypothetical protein
VFTDALEGRGASAFKNLMMDTVNASETFANPVPLHVAPRLRGDGNKYISLALYRVGRDGSVGIAARYGLDGPGIESRWGRDFTHHPDRPWGPPSLLYKWYRVFPGGKDGRGVTLTTHPI